MRNLLAAAIAIVVLGGCSHSAPVLAEKCSVGIGKDAFTQCSSPNDLPQEATFKDALAKIIEVELALRECSAKQQALTQGFKNCDDAVERVNAKNKQ